jgi:TonB family protein
MEMIIKRISPQSTSGSLILAALAHTALYGAILLAFAITAGHHPAEELTQTTELSYETFDAPPPPKDAPMPKPVVRDEPKEIQDKTSDIAGTQKEAPPAAAAPAAVQTTANVPYYKIKPKYPRAALVAGIEGWVALMIDVAEDGGVQNVRVTGGEQKSMFQDEARRSVEKWKYKPFLDSSGRPVKKANHEVRVDFKLSEAV